MKSDLKTRHGGKILADALVAQGAKLAFGVPGESSTLPGTARSAAR
jgi:hypothetical protein